MIAERNHAKAIMQTPHETTGWFCICGDQKSCEFKSRLHFTTATMMMDDDDDDDKPSFCLQKLLMKLKNIRDSWVLPWG